MISFKPVELADKATIEHYTHPSECRNCDMSFANIYCWRAFHQTHWAVVEGFLIIRFLIDGREQLGYMQPIGEGDFSHLLPLLEQDARENFGQPLRLYGLCREGRKCICESSLCHDFAFDDDRALSDYIYLADDLRTLAGRKYQPKRNHLNRFLNGYNYRYEPLTPDHFEACLQLEAAWRAARTSDSDSEAMRHEQRALREAFDHWQELDLIGGVLFVDDHLAAFTYGSRINYDTFDCHIEKADTQYEGIFAAINKLFADHLPTEFTYINREEDMGLEGLRRSKLSYYPTLLWPKTTALLLGDEQRACKALWQEVFGDEEAFVDRFLIHHFRSDRMFRIEEDCAEPSTLTNPKNQKLLSMLHLLPFRTEEGEHVGYIYGVATTPEARGRGLATRLLQEAIQRAQAEGMKALILIPADDQVRAFYARHGFSGEVPVRLLATNDFDFGTGTPERDRAMVLPLSAEFSTPTELELHKD